MKRLRRWLLLLATLLLIGAGAGMPWAAARVQDLYGIASREVLPLDTVSLTLRKESEIGAVLRMMGRSYELEDTPGETVLTEQGACAAALEALAEMNRYGLLESGWMEDYGYIEPDIPDRLKAGGSGSAMPLLLTGEDGTAAAVWWCSWRGPYCPPYELMIDDATGLAISGFIPCLPPDGAGDAELFYQRMEHWMNFFQDYYGIEIYGVADNVYDAAHEFLFGFDPGDGLGMCGLSVSLYGNEMDFRPSPVSVLLTMYQEDGAPAEKNHAAAG